MTKSAIISHCGTYRYRLDRMVSDSGPVYAFFGVNPSTADASVDDATVRKWRGFVQRWGGSRFIVGNVFAYRATGIARQQWRARIETSQTTASGARPAASPASNGGRGLKPHRHRRLHRHPGHRPPAMAGAD